MPGAAVLAVLATALLCAAPATAAFSCSTGTLAGTCTVDSAVTVDDGEVVEGVDLSVSSSGSISCATEYCSTLLRFSGTVTIDGEVSGATVHVNASTIIVSGSVDATGRGFFTDGPGTPGNSSSINTCELYLSGGCVCVSILSTSAENSRRIRPKLAVVVPSGRVFLSLTVCFAARLRGPVRGTEAASVTTDGRIAL